MRGFRESKRAWKEGYLRYRHRLLGGNESAQKKRLWYKFDWMYRAMLDLIGERIRAGKLEYIVLREYDTLAELCAVGGIKTARKRLEWYEGLTEFVFVTEGREALKRQMLLDSGGRD